MPHRPSSSPERDDGSLAALAQSYLEDRGLADSSDFRSRFIKALLHRHRDAGAAGVGTGTAPPVRSVIRYWNDLSAIPGDVQFCLDSWKPIEDRGFTLHMFDDRSAHDYIDANFGPSERRAFERCHHPAMRADYFRLCYLTNHGGIYIDADNQYVGGVPDWFLSGDRLWLQPLCYDVAIDGLLTPDRAWDDALALEGRCLYVANDPMVAPRRHPVVAAALERATRVVNDGSATDIQSATGPINLTIALVTWCAENGVAACDDRIAFIRDWDEVARWRLDLSYKADARYWKVYESAL